MKIQSLAVIFIIIILPISMILTAYSQNQITTLSLQSSYDSKLRNATYDAVKTFQLNTVNSSTSDITNSKMRDIEASVNSFFNSIASNFNMEGYNKDVLKEYVPALVYTMYDGYYIYSPYTNTLTDTEVVTDSKYQDNVKISGLKPYIYYSCRYKSGTIDVVITYTLDNYVTIQGINNIGNPINISGYIVDNVNVSGNTVTYRGVQIDKETLLKEYVGSTEYQYIKINGVKYYKEGSNWFSILNGKKYVQNGLPDYTTNDSALNYYKSANDFKNQLSANGLLNLTTAHAVDEQEHKINDFGNYKIFNYSGSIFNKDTVSIEESKSDFNQHRTAVIRYAIEKNLSIAIANYNNYGTTKANFQMPKLDEAEWIKIINNVSVISFLQGLSIGGKIYNGYAIVTNNKNEEVVTEESIYITTSDGQYHKVNDTDLVGNGSIRNGIFNISLERKSIQEGDNTIYYYPNRSLGCYNSVVSFTGITALNNETNTDNIYDYLADKSSLAKIYFTSLGRERYSMYKVNR